ncbi:MAG: hypothetical protein ABIB98_02925 [bacterium]
MLTQLLTDSPILLLILIIILLGISPIVATISVILDVRNSRKIGRELDKKRERGLENAGYFK